MRNNITFNRIWTIITGMSTTVAIFIIFFFIREGSVPMSVVFFFGTSFINFLYFSFLIVSHSVEQNSNAEYIKRNKYFIS